MSVVKVRQTHIHGLMPRRVGLGAQEVTRFQVTTDTHPLNVRAAPDYTTALVGTAKKDSAVVLIGARDVPGPVPGGTGTWANIRTQDGVEGWGAQSGVDTHLTLTELAPGADPVPRPVNPPNPAPTPTPSAPATGSSWTKPIIIGAVVVGGGVVAYAVTRKRSKSMRHAATAHEAAAEYHRSSAKRLREGASYEAAREGAAKRRRLRA